MAAPSATAAVDGVLAESVRRPESVGELAELLRDDPGAVVFRGQGTKLDWGETPRALDTIVDLSGLPAEIEHAAGDLVVRVATSVRLAALNEVLAVAGQRLAIDEVVPGSSVGGVIATGLSGPLRLGFGSVRDLLIGVRIVRADGVVARAGGRVVKNVAGYDLAKLFCGSYGTLGAITEAFFRCHPLPAATRYLVFAPSSPGELASACRAVASSRLAPGAIELDWHPAEPPQLCVALEGSPASVGARAPALAELLGIAPAGEGEAPPEHFGRLPGAATLKLTFAPGELKTLLGGLTPLVAAGAHLSGSVAVGVAYLGLAADAELGAVLGLARELATRCGGSAIVLRAPRSMRAGLDLFGPTPAPGLQRAVKQAFDPLDRLAPGRFVGDR